MMTAKNYNLVGGALVDKQHTNIGYQVPFLLLKSWISRHTMGVLGCLSCRVYTCFSSFSAISQFTFAFVGSLIRLAIPWEITPPQSGP